MDISALHTATENLAEWLSEVTQGDLGQPTPVPDQDVGDLYLHLIERNTSITSVLTTETEPLRQHAHLMCRSASTSPRICMAAGSRSCTGRLPGRPRTPSHPSLLLDWATALTGSTSTPALYMRGTSTRLLSTLGTWRKQWDSTISQPPRWHIRYGRRCRNRHSKMPMLFGSVR